MFRVNVSGSATHLGAGRMQTGRYRRQPSKNCDGRFWQLKLSVLQTFQFVVRRANDERRFEFAAAARISITNTQRSHGSHGFHGAAEPQPKPGKKPRKKRKRRKSARGDVSLAWASRADSTSRVNMQAFLVRVFRFFRGSLFKIRGRPTFRRHSKSLRQTKN